MLNSTIFFSAGGLLAFWKSKFVAGLLFHIERGVEHTDAETPWPRLQQYLLQLGIIFNAWITRSWSRLQVVASVELQAMLSSGATSDIEVVSRRRSRHNSSLHRYLAVDAALVPKHGRQRTQAALHKNNAQECTRYNEGGCFMLFPKTSKNNIINHTNTETVQTVQIFQSRNCSKQLSFPLPCSMASLQLLTRPRPMRCVGGVRAVRHD